MLSFDASTYIAATPDHVWSTLVQTSRWTDWDPALEQVDGELREGGRLTLRVVGTSRPFSLKVMAWEPPNRIVVVSGMPLGLFRGTRTYGIAPDGRGATFTMGERFTGPLAPMITTTIPDLQPSFDAFAHGLRTAAEA